MQKTVSTEIKVIDTIGLGILVVGTGLVLNGSLLRWLMCFCIVFAIAEIASVLVFNAKNRQEDVARLPEWTVYLELYALLAASVAIFVTRASGRQLILCVGVAVATDAGGLAIGRLFCNTKYGKTVRALRKISPNKTYIGYVGEIIVGYITGWVLCSSLGIFASWRILAFCLFAPFVGALGDICASACKRSIRIKDSNSALATLPIVGKVEWLTKSRNGFLDMFDSISFDLLFISLLLL